ncbi:alpha/beta fold hydrolase [Candidatus Woesearchaeota archaeon]|jgi:carboxylesterase|nr:alpha/beta fold hydrolase [Candidatus Woesearchaeota archaeon]
MLNFTKKRDLKILLIMSIILLLLLLLLVPKCSNVHVDPVEIKELKQQANEIMAVERTPETFFQLIEIIDQYNVKDKELHDLREMSQNFLYMYYEHPSPKGVLLIHGLGASPNEVRELAEFLDKEGYTVMGVRLSGHGEGLDILEKTSWKQWYREVEFAYDMLDYLTDETYVVGMSTGGSLGLLLAKNKEFDGLVTIAPAVKMKDWKVNFIWLFKYFQKYSERTLTEEEKVTYDEAVPTQSVHELKKSIKSVKRSLKHVEEPILIMQATNDPRVKKENAEYVYNNIATSDKDKEIKWIESNKHVILDGETQNEVFNEILEFVK